MTNWVVVAVGFAVIGFGVLLYRYASSVSSLQQRQANAMFPEFIRPRFTPRLARLGGIWFAMLGVIALLMGAFLGDKM